MDKLKILMCSEASFLSSGFGTYAREILSRLHKTNKYHIAEFASYSVVNDSRDKGINWRFYANAVREGDPRYQEYMSRSDNQFGRWRFEKVLLDFRPDVVIDVRDYWMSHYQSLSPLRKYFHWILMPTVDSEPQQEEWIDTFLNADAIFTYSDWGAEVLKKQSSGRINYIDTTSPGVNLSTFKILPNKFQIKQDLGIPTDSIIIGSVMRNQKRKLIPELLYAFRKTLDTLETKNYDLGSKLYLYLHTSYPDAGWDIPELLKQTRLSNRVFFTYFCHRCGHVESHTYSHPVCVCRNCFENTCKMPSVALGVPDNILANIYNTFDLYVQYAICEGFGMPQVEAAACGVPIVTIDYSAMCDIIKKLNAYKINIQTKFKELETKALRVYPNNDELVDCILRFIELDDLEKEKKRQETRQLAIKHYNWDNISAIWEKYLDKLDESGYRAQWNAPPKILSEIPPDQKDLGDVRNHFLNLVGLYINHLNAPEKIGTMMALNLSKDTFYGFQQQGVHYRPYNSEEVINTINALIRNNNQAEMARINNIKFDEDFIQYAEMKENS